MRLFNNLWVAKLMHRAVKLLGFLITFSLLMLPAHSSAQTQTPPSGISSQNTGEVSGVIVNQSPGGEVSEAMDIMLHAWDANRANQLMLHGQSTSDGSFSFIDVDLQPGLYYAVMVNYQGAVYFSEPVTVQLGDSLSGIQVPVYDFTQDLSALEIEQMHILFTWAEKDLGVTEVYILSNKGEYAIKESLTLDDGTPVTYKLPLPESAWNVRFAGDNGERFNVYPGGFADTAPLVPGEPSSQVIVSYNLPYETGMVYTYHAPLDIASIDLLYPQEAGMLVVNDLLEPNGEWNEPGGKNFLVYSHPPLRSAETVNVAIYGEPPLDATFAPDVEPNPSFFERIQDFDLGYVSLGLGLVFIAAGVLLWRRSTASTVYSEDGDEAGFPNLLAELIELDEAVENEEIQQGEYLNDRAALHKLIRAEMDKWEQLHAEAMNLSQVEAPETPENTAGE